MVGDFLATEPASADARASRHRESPCGGRTFDPLQARALHVLARQRERLATALADKARGDTVTSVCAEDSLDGELHAADRAGEHLEPDHPADDCGAGGRADHDIAPAATREPIAVTPRGELRPQRRTDADQFEAFANAREADVVGGEARARVAEHPLAGVDSLESRVERDQVPPGTRRADHPESPLRRVERQPAPDREGLQDLVGSEILGAVETGAVHGRNVS